MSEKIIQIIEKLGEIRNIPQFLFFGGISASTMIESRKNILKYKSNNKTVEEIDFILNSSGGSPADAYRIIRTLRNNFEKVNIIIPFWAKSAATLLSLGGTSIIMDEFGEFGPLDIQINKEKDDGGSQRTSESALNDEYSVSRIEARSQELFHKMFIDIHKSDDIKINKNELSKQLFDYLSKFYTPLLNQINPYSLGKKKRLLAIGEQYANRILLLYNSNIDDRKRVQLIDYLVNGCPDHGYIIDYSLISIFLANVKKSSEISVEYEDCLRELATEFIILDGTEFANFIVKRVESSNTKETKGEVIEEKKEKKGGVETEKVKTEVTKENDNKKSNGRKSNNN